MKTTRCIIGDKLIKLTALLAAIALVPSSLCLDTAYAAENNEETVTDVIEEKDYAEGNKMQFYKNGELYEVEATSGGDWPDDTVTGTDEPTLKARSIEEYNAQKVGGSISEDLYTLTVSTGINPGTSVEYFAIRYTDVNDTPQTKYIFANEERQKLVEDYIGILKTTRKVLSGYNVTGERMAWTPGSMGRSRLKEVTETIYYAADKVDDADKEFDTIISKEPVYTEETGAFPDGKAERFSNQALKDMGYTINEELGAGNNLSAWSIDELLFTTPTAIKTVNGIEVFMSDGKWTVQGLSISRVTSIGGYGEYGYYSGKYFMSLGKQRLCELVNLKNGTQTFNADGDTLINIGGARSSYFSLRQLNESAAAASGFDDLYTFRLDFADVLDGGIESLLRNDSSVSDPTAGAVAEHLAIDISYKDKNGWTRSVTMPVLLSVLGQYKDSGDTVRTMGLAQRGDTLAFTACLPEFNSLISYRLYVGSAARDKIKTDCGIATASVNTSRDKLIEAMDSDFIRVAGVSVYKGTCRMSNTPDGEDSITGEALKSYTVTYDFLESAPFLYYTTTNAQGFMVNPGTSDVFKLTAYDPKAPLIGSAYDANVLIRIRTDTAPGSEPSGTTRIRLTYQDTSGSELTSPLYTISDEVKNYLGYWPSDVQAKDNFAYSYGTQPGNIVEFPVKLSDISAITNVELNVGRDSDEWQISGMSIAVVRSVGKRRIYSQDNDTGNISSGYKIVRTMDKTVISPFPINVQLLITTDDSYSFNTGTGTIVTGRETDFNSIRYSMTYEQTKEDLGYARRRKVYDINVKVADDPDAGNINGDSGSSNHFYFQLRFKGGSSAFVLANQQLSSDAFRAGRDEVFTIAVNRDYGDVTGIRIIPEDVSEDSDVFDKLNIEQISVTEQTSGGSADQFVFDNIGWIDIDYHDKSQDSAIKTRAGRSVAEVSKTYNLSYKQKVINLLCEVDTWPWETDYIQVEGSIACDLEYVDTNGQPRTVSFDVVSRMASYMNKTARSFEGAADGSNAALYNNMGTVSDPNWMLRPGHTDRFILPSLANPRSITSMTFKATSRNNKPGKWVIGGVTLYRIKSDSGVVKLTADGEYLRSMQTVRHCEMVKKDGKLSEELYLPAGEPQKLTIYFTENTITWAENSAWATSVSKFPESTNDSLNVFIYPDRESKNIADSDVNMVIQYNMSNSRLEQVKQNGMNVYGSGTENAMFYYTGLAATDMKNISTMTIYCRDSNVGFDHAIVQQVREGVVVMTYTFSFGGASATLGMQAQPSSYTKIYEPMKQTLMLSLGEDTKEMALFGMSDDNLNPNDIAVCLKYRSTLDKSSSEYYSPYVYLTEAGINKIYPGMMAEIPFDVPYVSEITGYRLISFGNLSASIDSAMALNYSRSEADSEAMTLQQCYSFSQRYEAGNLPRELDAVTGTTGEGTVAPIDLYFTTASAGENSESGINVPVQAEFVYTDSKDAPQTLRLDDLRVYIQSVTKQFATGERTQVRLFIPDLNELTEIRLIPSDGSWKLDTIEAYRLGEELVNRKVDMTFDTNGGYIPLRRVTLSTNVTADEVYKGRVNDHQMNLRLEGGKIVSGTVIVGNSDLGFGLRVDDITNGLPAEITEETASIKDEAFAVAIPENEGSVPTLYSITVWALDNPTIKDVINVTVPAKAQTVTIVDDRQPESSESEEASETEPSQDEEESSGSDDTSVSNDPPSEEADPETEPDQS